MQEKENQILLPKKIEIHVILLDKIKPLIFEQDTKYAMLLFNPLNSVIYNEPAPTLYSFVSDYVVSHTHINIDVERTDINDILQKINKCPNYSCIETLLIDALQYQCMLFNTLDVALEILYRLGYVDLSGSNYLNSIMAMLSVDNKSIVDKIARTIFIAHYNRIKSILEQNDIIDQVSDLFKHLANKVEQAPLGSTSKHIQCNKELFEKLIDKQTRYKIVDCRQWLGKTYQIYLTSADLGANEAFVIYWYDRQTIKQLLQLFDHVFTILHLTMSVNHIHRNNAMLATYKWYTSFIAYLYVILATAYEKQKDKGEIALIQYVPDVYDLYYGLPDAIYVDTAFSLPLPILLQVAFRIYKLISKGKLPKDSDRVKSTYVRSYAAIPHALHIQLTCNANIETLLSFLINQQILGRDSNGVDLCVLYSYILITRLTEHYVRSVFYDIIVDYQQRNKLFRETDIPHKLFANRNIRNIMDRFAISDKQEDVFIIESLDYLGGRPINVDILMINPRKHGFRNYAHAHKDKAITVVDLDSFVPGLYREYISAASKLVLMPVTLKVIT